MKKRLSAFDHPDIEIKTEEIGAVKFLLYFYLF